MTSSNLTLIETVTSTKLANKINSQVKQGTLGVFVQVWYEDFKFQFSLVVQYVYVQYPLNNFGQALQKIL